MKALLAIPLVIALSCGTAPKPAVRVRQDAPAAPSPVPTPEPTKEQAHVAHDRSLTAAPALALKPPKMTRPPAPKTEVTALILSIFGPTIGPHAVQVAWCESHHRPNAVSPSRRHLGLFQISERYHSHRIKAVGREGHTLFDPETNVRVAKHLYDEQGWRPWSCG